jgi:hypothetical protein
MKRFLAVYTGSAAAVSRWEALSEAECNERHAAGFKAWSACPHFTLFPGEGVEVMECLPVPSA